MNVHIHVYMDVHKNVQLNAHLNVYESSCMNVDRGGIKIKKREHFGAWRVKKKSKIQIGTFVNLWWGLNFSKKSEL